MRSCLSGTFAELLIRDILVSTDQAPIVHTGCRFGCWCHSTGQALRFFDEWLRSTSQTSAARSLCLQFFEVSLQKSPFMQIQ